MVSPLKFSQMDLNSADKDLLESEKHLARLKSSVQSVLAKSHGVSSTSGISGIVSSEYVSAQSEIERVLLRNVNDILQSGVGTDQRPPIERISEIPQLVQTLMDDVDTAKRRLRVANDRLVDIEVSGVVSKRSGGATPLQSDIQSLRILREQLRAREQDIEELMAERDHILKSTTSEIDYLSSELHAIRRMQSQDATLTQDQLNLAHREMQRLSLIVETRDRQIANLEHTMRDMKRAVTEKDASLSQRAVEVEELKSELMNQSVIITREKQMEVDRLHRQVEGNLRTIRGLENDLSKMQHDTKSRLQVDALAVQIESLERDLVQAKKIVKDKDSEVSVLLSKLKAKGSACSEFELSLGRADSELEDRLEEIHNLQNDNARQRRKILDLESTVASQKAELDLFGAKWKGAEKEIKESSASMAKIAEMQGRMEAAELQRNELKAKSESLAAELGAARAKIEKQERALFNLEVELDNVKATGQVWMEERKALLASFQQEKKDMQKEWADERKAIQNEFSELQKKSLTEWAEQKRALQTESESQRYRLTEALSIREIAAAQEIEAVRFRYAQELEATTKTALSLNEEVTKHKSNISDLEAKIAVLQEDLSIAEFNKKALSAEVQTLEESLVQQTDKTHQLEERLNSLASELFETNIIETRNLELETEVSFLRKTIGEIRQELDDLRLNHKSDLQRYDTELGHMETELDAAESALMEELHASFTKELEDAHSVWNARIEGEIDEKRELELQVAHFKSIENILQHENLVLQNQLSLMAELRAENDRLKDQLENLADQVSSYTALQVERDCLRAEGEGFRSDLQVQENAVSDLQKAMKVLELRITSAIEQESVRTEQVSARSAARHAVDNSEEFENLRSENNQLREEIEQMRSAQVEQAGVANAENVEALEEERRIVFEELMKIIKETSRAGDEEVDAASTTIPDSVYRVRQNIEQMVNFFNDQLESREADMNWFRSELDRLRFQNEQLGKEKDVEVEKRKQLELDSRELCYKTTELWDKFQDFKRIQG